MAHQQPHPHHDFQNTRRRLIITMLLNFLITFTEILGGVFSGSLSLISDALHNFSDGISVLISYLALKLKNRDFSHRHTFGYKRIEIFAAVINSGVLLVICFYLFYEAFIRFFSPSPITGGLMTMIAVIGLFANIIGTLLLQRDAKQSMNIRSAYLHLFTDVLSSIGVVLGGLVIYFWKVYWVDPALTILISLYILKESYQILSQAIHILMEGAPFHISAEEIREVVEAISEVQDIHHVHMWMVGDNDVHFEAHVNVNDMLISETDRLRQKIETLLIESFSIQHVTLQFECDQCLEEGLIKKGTE